MRFGRRLGRRFFERGSVEVAQELIGCVLVRRLPTGERLAGKIVEVEAYLGDGSDAASHAHRGPTPRNHSMFGPPGHLYTYRSYGIHTCANLVCEAKGRANAVLLRAILPLLGIERMRANRQLAPETSATLIARGPGRLAQALALSLDDDGRSVLAGDIGVHRPPSDWPELAVLRGPRIGISKAADLPYRFHVADTDAFKWVSAKPIKPRAGP
jgi:DNA-3-methyladenine glycosylase